MTGVPHTTRLKIIALAGISLFAASKYAYAQSTQTIPDAGSLLRDIERQQQKVIPKVSPKPEVKKEQPSEKVEATVFVKEFRIINPASFS